MNYVLAGDQLSGCVVGHDGHVATTCGNSTNAALREVLGRTWPDVARRLEAGDALVEIGDS